MRSDENVRVLREEERERESGFDERERGIG